MKFFLKFILNLIFLIVSFFISLTVLKLFSPIIPVKLSGYCGKCPAGYACIQQPCSVDAEPFVVVAVAVLLSVLTVIIFYIFNSKIIKKVLNKV